MNMRSSAAVRSQVDRRVGGRCRCQGGGAGRGNCKKKRGALIGPSKAAVMWPRKAKRKFGLKKGNPVPGATVAGMSYDIVGIGIST